MTAPSTEAKFSVTGKAGSTLVTLRGDSYDEFVHNAKAALGEHEGATYAAEVFSIALLADVESAKAVQTINKSVGVASVEPRSNVVPMPGIAPQAVPSPEPPTVPYPGDCQHGRRVYKDSMARGKPWRRWDCAQAWVKGNDALNASRCKSLNVGD